MRSFVAAAAVCLMTGPVLAGQTDLIADLRAGGSATVSGVVYQIPDEDEFVLKDASGMVRIYIGPQIVPFEMGEALIVSGLVEREAQGLEIYARSAQRADGTRVSFDHRYD